jgi:tryptophan synthase beta chain
MGEEDIRRQAPNVFSMKLLGAEVRPVTSGSRTLRDAINEAMRDWMARASRHALHLGSVVGPHPFPMIVRDFQSVIGREARAVPGADRPAARRGRRLRRRRQQRGGHVLSVRRGPSVEAVGVEAGGRGGQPGDHASPLSLRPPGVLHGSFSYVMQDDDGQTCDVHSISAGLDYPGVGPEHSYWKDTGRVRTPTAATTRPWPPSTPCPQRRHPARPGKLARRGQGHRSRG